MENNREKNDGKLQREKRWKITESHKESQCKGSLKRPVAHPRVIRVQQVHLLDHLSSHGPDASLLH